MEYKFNKELSVKRVSILYDSLIELREEIKPIHFKDTEYLKEAYTGLEDAYKQVFDAEARCQVEL